MAWKVNRLFGKENDPGRAARIRLITTLLVVAVPLDLGGVLCCTSLPGAALTMIAWQLADNELARVEEGTLQVSVAPRLHRLRQLALWLLVWCTVTFALQIYLLTSGTYERWLSGL
ncbi:MAG: hypothetical protein H6739_06210 [Alphaproteobacteria bacterium]|nr:hypothetical protein [Alphaproteobacteria bacterium]